MNLAEKQILVLQSICIHSLWIKQHYCSQNTFKYFNVYLSHKSKKNQNNYNLFFKGRQEVDHITLIDHMTVVIEYIEIGYKQCERQVVWIVYIIFS